MSSAPLPRGATLPGLRHPSAERSRFRPLRGAALVCGLWLGAAGLSAVKSQTSAPPVLDPEASLLHQSLDYREQQRLRTMAGLEQHRVRVNLARATGPDVPMYLPVLRAAKAPPTPTQARNQAELRRLHYQDLLLGAATLLAGLLVVKKLLTESAGASLLEFNTAGQSPAALASVQAKVRAEEQAFAEFLAAFQVGVPQRQPRPPRVPEPASASVETVAEIAEGDLLEHKAEAPDRLSPQEDLEPVGRSVEKEPDPISAFFSVVPAWHTDLLGLLRKISKCRSAAYQKPLLCDLRDGFEALEGMSGFPELLPVWQMVTALKGLAGQLAERLNELTPSTLRTLAEGVELLSELSQPGLKADLCSNPPIRLLVVDDDPISRRALVYALERVFNAPEVAEDTGTAVYFTTEQAYDAIFLDMQTPGLDALEAGAKIHDTPANTTTPVVFLTTLDEFEMRANLIRPGDDLIAKPFMSFEITVKALTIALRGRLRSRGRNAAAVSPEICAK